MRLNIVNQFSIETDSGIVRRLRTRKTEELLAYLAIYQHRWISRSEVMAVLWPDDEETSARQKLRLALHSIRSEIGGRLECDGELIKVTGLAVDALDTSLSSFGSGWRLMPGHQAEWLDQWAASTETQLQVEAIAKLADPATTDEIVKNLNFLIAADPDEPELYVRLWEHYSGVGSSVAARIVAHSARTKFGRFCPKELAAEAHLSIASDFVGRFAELTELTQKLLGDREPALVQLVGFGGLGKSRLARELCSLAPAEDIPTQWVSLEGITDGKVAEEVFMGGLSSLLGLTAEEAIDPAEVSSALIVLDNAEDVEPGGLAFLGRYQTAECGLRVLVTSQTLRSEVSDVVTLRPLGLPRGESLEQVTEAEAMRLMAFHSAKPVMPENVRDYYALALESAGVPLAVQMIGLAARQTSLSTVVEQLKAGTKQIKFADYHPIDSSRYLSLGATLTWSFARLDSHLQESLRRLSALRGRFDAFTLDTLDVAEQDVEELVQLGWIQDGNTLLPPVQRFLREQFSDASAHEANLKHAMAKALFREFPENYGVVCALGETYSADIIRWLSNPEDLTDEVRGALLVGLHVTADKMGLTSAFQIQMAEVLSRLPHYPWRSLLGGSYYLAKDFAKAEAEFKLLMKSDDPETTSVAMANLALIEMNRGRYQEAATKLIETVAMTSHPRRKVARLINLASAQMLMDDHEGAIKTLHQAKTELDQAGSLPSFEMLLHLRLAEVRFCQGEFAEAESLALIALDGFEQNQQWHHMADVYAILLFLAARNQDIPAIQTWSEALLKLAPETPVVAAIFGRLFAQFGLSPAGIAAAENADQVPLLCRKLAYESPKDQVQLGRKPLFALIRQTLKRL